MSTSTSEGSCYLCGKILQKSDMSTHLKEEVCPEGNIQRCTLLKV